MRAGAAGANYSDLVPSGRRALRAIPGATPPVLINSIRADLALMLPIPRAAVVCA